VYHCNLERLGAFYSGPDYGSTGHPIVLREGEYYFLGDNSSRSKDSRFWGAASRSDLIGVARWIYWPPHRWREFR